MYVKQDEKEKSPVKPQYKKINAKLKRYLSNRKEGFMSPTQAYRNRILSDNEDEAAKIPDERSGSRVATTFKFAVRERNEAMQKVKDECTFKP